MRERGPFREGDRVQARGPKGALNSFTLVAGERFHTNRGWIEHNDILGKDEGSVLSTTVGTEYLMMRPLLNDFVMAMTRGAAIVYPKDAGQILQVGDIGLDDIVVEAGVGSGALSLYLLRAVGPQGHLYSFERREEFADIAMANVDNYFGSTPDWWTVTIGDLSETLPAAVADHSVDRVVLDMLAPWETLASVADVLRPGGVLVVYVATVTQLSRTTEALRLEGCFTEPVASETIVRDWHIEGLAVRPEHRMVGHTGFLLVTRRLADDTVDPFTARRANAKPEFTDDDIETWTPGAVGDRSQHGKRLRKSVRRAQADARLRKPSE